MSDLLDRLRGRPGGGLLERLRRIVEREGRLPGWEDEPGSDERLPLLAHVRADERGVEFERDDEEAGDG